VANKIWYIEDKQIKEYPGTYDEYEYWKKKNEAELKGVPLSIPSKKPEPKAPKAKPIPNIEEQRKLKTLHAELKKVEEEISRLEAEKSKAENHLSIPAVYSDFEKLREAQQEFDKVNEALASQNKKWEVLVIEIEERE
jgi:ATP-binding cassette subfamily F protein 3